MVLHAFPQDPETQATPEQLNTAALQRIDIVSRETEAQGLGALRFKRMRLQGWCYVIP